MFIMSFLGKMFGRSSPDKEKVLVKGNISLKDLLSSAERSFFSKLTANLIEDHGLKNVSNSEILDLVVDLIMIEKNLDESLRGKVKDEMIVFLKKEQVFREVSTALQEPNIDEIISAEVKDLLLESEQQINEICLRIYLQVRKKYVSGKDDNLPMSDDSLTKMPELNKKDRGKILQLREKMLEQLEPAQGSAYRRQLKRFVMEVDLDENNFEKFNKIIASVDGFFKDKGVSDTERRKAVFELVADYIIASENRVPMEKPAIVNLLKDYSEKQNLKLNARQAAEKRAEKMENYFINQRRYIADIYLQRLKEYCGEGRVSLDEAAKRARGDVFDIIKMRRKWKNRFSEAEIEQKINDILNSDSAIEAEIRQRRLEELEAKVRPKIIDSYAHITELCKKFVEGAKELGVNEREINKRNKKLYADLIDQYESVDNLYYFEFSKISGRDEIERIMKIFEEEDLAVFLNKLVAVFENGDFDFRSSQTYKWRCLLGVFFRRKIESMIEDGLKSSKKYKQSSSEVVKINNEIDELNERFNELPEDMKADKTFRKQIDGERALLNGKRKALLNGEYNAYNFFAEHDPAILQKQLQFLLSGPCVAEKGGLFVNWGAKINKMIGAGSAYLKGGNRDWTNFNIE